MLFTCIKSWFFRNHLANFHQISHWSFCWNVVDSLFKWSCSIDCQAHLFFFKTKNCSNDDIFISCDDRIGKMLHNICMSAVAMSLRWANRGPWASCFVINRFFFSISKFSDAEFSSLTSKKPAYCFLLKADKCTVSLGEITVCASKQLFLLVTKKKKVSKSHRIYPVSPVKSLIGLLRCTPDDAIQFGTVLV